MQFNVYWNKIQATDFGPGSLVSSFSALKHNPFRIYIGTLLLANDGKLLFRGRRRRRRRKRKIWNNTGAQKFSFLATFPRNRHKMQENMLNVIVFYRLACRMGWRKIPLNSHIRSSIQREENISKMRWGILEILPVTYCPESYRICTFSFGLSM